MARAIEIRYCGYCGQLESMTSRLDAANDRNVIEVGCTCGAQPPRITELGAKEPYYLAVQTRRKEESGDEDSDSGDVLAQHERDAEEL